MLGDFPFLMFSICLLLFFIKVEFVVISLCTEDGIFFKKEKLLWVSMIFTTKKKPKKTMTSRGHVVANNVAVNHSTCRCCSVWTAKMGICVLFFISRFTLKCFFLRTFVKYMVLMYGWSLVHDWTKLFTDWISTFFCRIFAFWIISLSRLRFEKKSALLNAAHFRHFLLNIHSGTADDSIVFPDIATLLCSLPGHCCAIMFTIQEEGLGSYGHLCT